MFILYDLIFLIITIVYLPIYLLRGKFHHGFLSRLGFMPRGLKLSQPIWVHTVSVGEAQAIKGLVEELRNAYPGKQFVFSTVTQTGNQIVKGIAKEGDFITYLPLDFSFIVSRVMKQINPSLFIIAETEIWPNLIRCLYKRKTPVVVVNGRISDASFSGYLTIKFLIRPILRKITFFCAQSSLDAQRLMRLGLTQAKIAVTGNMKFDQKAQTYNFDAAHLALGEKEQLLVCGSTHYPEEEIILEAYKEILEEFSGLKLLIAPRHPERAPEIETIISRSGFRPVRISGLSAECKHCIPRPVFILDTIGQLVNFYALADVVFIGGSLIKKGGHNILEPAVLGKPILFGPYMFNFRDISELFLENNAAIMVQDRAGLKNKLLSLLKSPAEMASLGKRAKELMRQNEGATLRSAQYIRKIIAREAPL